MSIVNFPYVQYVTIICVVFPLGCCIKVDTTILVSSLLILGNCVKCIPIYLIPFVSHYCQRWFPLQRVQVIRNSVVTPETCLQPTAETPDVFTCNPVVTLVWVFGAQNVLVFISIRGHCWGT